MDNKSKRFGNFRTQLAGTTLVLAMALMAQLALAPAARADTPPPENPGCETYGCLYEHCPTAYTRDGQGGCLYGIAYQRLPDGPDNRRFVRVLWPDAYDPARRAMWDDVAYCESAWRWQFQGAHHGGVQFTASTWRAYGGEEFAPYAFQALAEQQIAVAERLAFQGWTRPDGTHAAAQGPGAWPHCGGGLTAPA